MFIKIQLTEFFLQRKLALLRVIDLNGILAEFSCPKNARKEDLQKNIVDLLKSAELTDIQKIKLKNLVEQSFSKM